MYKYGKDFIEKQKLILEKEKSRLEKALKITDKFPNYGDTEDENSEEVEEFYTSQGQEKQFKNMLEDVNKALKKIRSGEYGYCDNCGDKKLISKQRLEAFPAATTCIKCENNKK